MPKRAVNSMAWEVLTMAPRMSGRLRRIPPMCESLKSIPLRGVCENSDSTSSVSYTHLTLPTKLEV